MSEFSGKKSRGMMVSLVFAMQAAGLIVGPLLAAAFLASGLSKDLVWRLLLAFGAVMLLLAIFGKGATQIKTGVVLENPEHSHPPR